MLLTRPTTKTGNADRTAFLPIGSGGTACRAIATFRARFRADHSPFACHVLQNDTDRRDFSEHADTQLCIGLGPQDVAAMAADPAAYGPVCQTMVETYPTFMDPESIRNGARTMRMVTQLSCERHLNTIIEALYGAIRELLKRSACSHIIPVLFSSSGGGAGSAATLILASLLADHAFRGLITEGMDAGVLDLPVLVFVEPYAYALKNRNMQKNKILANMFATRIETALLEAERAFQYAFHIGLANHRGGVLDTEAEICKQLGTAVYSLCRNWSYVKSRWVDTVDGHRNRCALNPPRSVLAPNSCVSSPPPR